MSQAVVVRPLEETRVCVPATTRGATSDNARASSRAAALSPLATLRSKPSIGSANDGRIALVATAAAKPQNDITFFIISFLSKLRP